MELTVVNEKSYHLLSLTTVRTVPVPVRVPDTSNIEYWMLNAELQVFIAALVEISPLHFLYAGKDISFYIADDESLFH